MLCRRWALIFISSFVSYLSTFGITVNNGLTPFWEDVDGTLGDGADDVMKSLAKKILIVCLVTFLVVSSVKRKHSQIDLSSDVKDPAYLAEFRANVVQRVKLPPLNCVTPRCLNTTRVTVGPFTIVVKTAAGRGCEEDFSVRIVFCLFITCTFPIRLKFKVMI